MNPILKKIFDANKDKLFAAMREGMKADGKDFMVISFDDNGEAKTETFSNAEKKLISPSKIQWYKNEIDELREERTLLRLKVNELRSEINLPIIDFTKPGAINQIS